MLMVFFTEGGSVPARRFRVWHFLFFLKKSGIHYIELPSFPSKYYNFPFKYRWLSVLSFGILSLAKAFVRVLQIPLVLFADVVFIQRELLPYNIVFLERFIWLLNKNIVFDFDDSIFLYKKEIGSSIGKFLTKKDTIAETIKMSREVICGNAYLAEYARKYNRNVTVIPTVLDTDKYVPKNLVVNSEGGAFVIGWMGTSGNLKYLFSLRNVFDEIRGRYPQAKLKIVTDNFLFRDEFLDVIPTEFKKWSAVDEVRDLQSFNLGVMPLADDEWTKGKCGFKILQYMATGVPVVASAVGANNEIIHDGLSGFLVRSNAEWLERISEIIRNESGVADRFSKEGRDRVVKYYSIKAVFPIWLKVVKKAAKNPA